MKQSLFFFVLPIVLMAVSCGVSRSVEKPADTKTTEEMQINDNEYQPLTAGISALPPLIIYRTKGDYQFMVPVMLNDEKTEVVSFPAPTDMFYQGELAIPVNLEQGYLLDIRGVGPNTAFLRMTYKTYSELDSAPSAADLYNLIFDKDPFLEMYICGNRGDKKQDIEKANLTIREGKLTECESIK